MNLIFGQYIAWFLALIEIIVGLYILAINIWNNANRHVGVWLLLVAAGTVASGFVFTSTTIERINSIYTVQAMLTPAVQVGLLIVTAVLLTPQMMQGRWKWLWLAVYAAAFLPMLLTLSDTLLGTELWFSGAPPGLVVGPQLSMTAFERGRFAIPIRALNIGLPIVGTLLAVYTALRKGTPLVTRRTAWLLFVGLLSGFAAQSLLRGLLTPTGASIFSSFVFAILFTYIGFQQMVSERRLQRGRLLPRLTLVILVVTIPLLMAVSVMLTSVVDRGLGELTDSQLQLTSNGLKTNVQTWLNFNIQYIQELASLPEIVSMDPKLQEPVLRAKARSFPQFFLVHTTDLTGMNVARNDGGALQNYIDRQWFQGARKGQPTIEVLVSRTTGRPAMNMAVPIRDVAGDIIGVASIVSELDDISAQIAVNKVGKTGVTYIVDSANRMVAHLDPKVVMKDNQLVDTTPLSPVAHLRTNGAGPLSFTDEQGTRWRAYVDKLDQGWGAGWGIIVQQQESELLTVSRVFQTVAWAAVLLGALVLGTLVSLAVRQVVQPIGALTQVAAAIAAGDFTRTAPVESEDELGALARSFNGMTEQLREMIGGLEQRVAERTTDLKRRSDYLAASAQVARAASSILESERLVTEIVELIRERFSLYYVGLFLVDERKEWAVLRAGTGEAGRAMLARGHKLAMGSSSMIGWSIANAQARIALQAETDAVRRATAELPDTRSEAALPLRSRDQVIGALTVQSAQPNAFDADTVTVLQTMADQVAIALENARLLTESQEAVEGMRRVTGELSREGWQQILRTQAVPGFRSAASGVTQVQGDWPAEAQLALQEKQIVRADGGVDAGRNARGQATLAIPIKVRGNVIGVIDTARPAGSGQWAAEEIALAETLADQLGTALESARLYQDTQRRAAREQLVGQVTTRMRESLDVERILQTAVRELGQAVGASQVNVRLVRAKDLSEAKEDLGEQADGNHDH